MLHFFLCIVGVVVALLYPAQVLSSSSSSSSFLAPYQCTSNADCEHLGTCSPSTGTCECYPGFTGPSCGTIDLLPVITCPGNEEGCLPLWPKTGTSNASAWGFTTVFDPSDNMYHAFVTIACGLDGVIGQGGGLSWIGHVASQYPDRDFQLVAPVVPQTSFGPHVAVSPNGTFVLVFRVNLFNDTLVCTGNGTGSDPLPNSFFDNAYIPQAVITPGDPEKGTNMFVAWADKMTGPWQVTRLNVIGAGGVHKSNPSVNFLSDGRVVLSYRYNPPVGELLSFAFAVNNDFRGPYQSAYNLTNGSPGDEDPFVWQQKIDGTLHAIYHNRDFGYHAFATDKNGTGGYAWSVSPIPGTHAFNLSVTLDNSTTIMYQRRERPELRFDSTSGLPLALINGVVSPYSTSYVLTQPVNTN